MMIQYSVGANFVLFVTNWLRNSGKLKGYPDDTWTVRIWTVKFPGDIWIVKIWTVKTKLGARVRVTVSVRFKLRVRVSVRFRVSVQVRLGLVMTVQFMTVKIVTVHIKAGNHGTAAPTFWPMSIVAKRLDGSRCHLVWR